VGPMEWNGMVLRDLRLGRKEGSNYSCIWSGLVWSGLVWLQLNVCGRQLTQNTPHVFKMLSENVSIFTILALSKPVAFLIIFKYFFKIKNKIICYKIL
jgi:hypothetical protein